jgi:hypothetical protein
VGQHSYDADCELFLKVFMEAVDDRLRVEQERIGRDIIAVLKLVDAAINTRVSSCECDLCAGAGTRQTSCFSTSFSAVLPQEVRV